MWYPETRDAGRATRDAGRGTPLKQTQTNGLLCALGKRIKSWSRHRSGKPMVHSVLLPEAFVEADSGSRVRDPRARPPTEASLVLRGNSRGGFGEPGRVT